MRGATPSEAAAALRPAAAVRRPVTLFGIAGATTAVAAVAAVLLSPARVAEALRPRALAEAAEVACTDPATCPEARRAASLARVATQLEARLPVVAGADRDALAQAIVDEAERAHIDPLLVLALIEVESSFDPAAASGRGARGLMQLRPSTMRREAERSGLEFGDPHDPVANVRAGVRYLRRLLDAFGREEVALMAYNAGPNRILAYLRAGAIPERFHVYPRRVKRELHRLRRSAGAEAAPTVAEAGAVDRQGRRAALLDTTLHARTAAP